MNGQPVDYSITIRSKNFTQVIPNTAYFFRNYEVKDHVICYYDANKNFISRLVTNALEHAFSTPSNCYFIKIRVDNTTTYTSGICINFHWDGERDGEYEPYKSTTYDLSGSHLVTRNYEYRAYQSGDESLANTITDGTNTVTKRTTPITETVTNPTLYGIWKLDANNNLYFDGDSFSDFPNISLIDEYGTEEFVDDREVPIPVGNDTDFTQAISIASLPTADGTYNATLTMSNGIATMSFVSTS